MVKSEKTISLDHKLWSRIDRIRKDVPRSRFVAKILTDYFATLHLEGGDNS